MRFPVSLSGWGFIFAGILGVFSGCHQAVRPPQIFPAAIDAGLVARGTTIHREVEFRNSLRETIRIEKIATSCACTLAEISRSDLGPGELARLTVEIDTSIPTKGFRTGVDLFWRAKNSSTEGSANLVIVGEITDPVDLTPAFVDLGTLEADGPAKTAPFELKRGNAPLSWDSLRIKSKRGTVPVIPVDANRFQTKIPIDPAKLPIGTFTESFTIELFDGQKRVASVAGGKISAQIAADVEARPRTLYVATQTVGKPARGSFQIRSVRPMKFIAIRSPDTGHFTATLVSRTDQKLIFEYEYTPIVEGSFSGQLLVDVETQKPRSISVPIAGFAKKTP